MTRVSKSQTFGGAPVTADPIRLQLPILSTMPSDEEISRRSLDLQKRARDVPLTQIPGYREWSKQRLAEGESEALIAHLDATAMWLLPEDIDSVPTGEFDEMLDDLKSTIGSD